MWKRIALIFIIFLITISCTNNEATNAPLSGIHFPQMISTPNAYMEALIKGELVLDNGCLRVRGLDGAAVLLIWDSRFLIQIYQGVVQVVDSRSGEVLASVNDFVAVGGGFVDYPTGLGLKEPLPDGCPEPYYLVGEIITKIDKP